jgi:hypothetical protein
MSSPSSSPSAIQKRQGVKRSNQSGTKGKMQSSKKARGGEKDAGSESGVAEEKRELKDELASKQTGKGTDHLETECRSMECGVPGRTCTPLTRTTVAELDNHMQDHERDVRSAVPSRLPLQQPVTIQNILSVARNVEEINDDVTISSSMATATVASNPMSRVLLSPTSPYYTPPTSPYYTPPTSPYYKSPTSPYYKSPTSPYYTPPPTPPTPPYSPTSLSNLPDEAMPLLHLGLSAFSSSSSCSSSPTAPDSV